jgi:hypothetical protein
VTIRGNRFQDAYTAATTWASHVQIISGSHDIDIIGNTFDTAANQNPIQCIMAGPGGPYPTPHDLRITGNTFRLRPNAVAVSAVDVPGVLEKDNTVEPLP